MHFLPPNSPFSELDKVKSARTCRESIWTVRVATATGHGTSDPTYLNGEGTLWQ